MGPQAIIQAECKVGKTTGSSLLLEGALCPSPAERCLLQSGCTIQVVGPQRRDLPGAQMETWRQALSQLRVRSPDPEGKERLP